MTAKCISFFLSVIIYSLEKMFYSVNKVFQINHRHSYEFACFVLSWTFSCSLDFLSSPFLKLPFLDFGRRNCSQRQLCNRLYSFNCLSVFWLTSLLFFYNLLFIIIIHWEAFAVSFWNDHFPQLKHFGRVPFAGSYFCSATVHIQCMFRSC